MPPFLAQGLCSGFRDAHNLAWKLDLVLKGISPPGLLDAYADERLPNARATIIESMRVGQNVIERDVEQAHLRDERLLALWAQAQAAPQTKQLIAFRVPGYGAGLIADNTPGAGDALGQARVRIGGREGLLDDVAGRGFMLLARGGNPLDALSPVDQAFWRSLGGTAYELDAAASGSIEDVEGYYGRLLDEYGAGVLLKRPDYYLFGTAPDLPSLPALVGELRQKLAPA
jgi:hypothetical protein